MSWVRRLLTAVLIVEEQQEIIRKQRRLLQIKDAQAEARKLEYVRNTRDLIENFWIAQEGGIDVREPLLLGLRDLRDEVARLEEHAPCEFPS